MSDEKKPNILLIVADQWRGDALGIHGHPVVETAYLDDLARRGVSFSSAYSSVPTCIAARAALFTGMKPHNHGRVGYRDRLPWRYDNMLAMPFSQAGYHTQAVGKMHVYPARNRCGFNDVVLHDGFLHTQMSDDAPLRESTDFVDDYLVWARRELGSRYDLMDMGLDCNGFMARPWSYPEYTHPTNWVAEMSEDFLRRRDPTAPFFLYSSFHRPHAPYDPPRDFFDQYRDAELPEVPLGDVSYEDTQRDGRIATTQAGSVDKRARDRALKAYYASLTHIDHQIGRILSRVVDAGEAGNTIVIFTSDLGDLLGDHNYWRKSSPLEGASRIPLIIYDPTGRLQYKPGSVSDEPVELMDIMPTLLDLSGLDIPESVDGLPIGQVLSGRIKGHNYVHGEHSHGGRSYHMIRHRDGRKYSWFDQTGEEWLFNLNDDPQELRNLAPKTEAEDDLEELRAILIAELQDREEGYVQDGKLVPGAPILDTLKNSTVWTGRREADG